MTSQTESHQKIFDLFLNRGALLEGHFILSSGLHSDQYLQSALLLQDPTIAETLGQQLAALLPDPIDTVISPAIGGLIIGHEVARAKGCRALFSEKDSDGKPILRRGFQIKPNEKILVIEDVITTGLSTSEVIHLVERAKGNLVGIGSIVNRTGQQHKYLDQWKEKVHSLLTRESNQWPVDQCPLCKRKIPAVKPGSRKI